ncbi:hypothetical protein MRX96_036777 [Rhipicephalus microplus]
MGEGATTRPELEGPLVTRPRSFPKCRIVRDARRQIGSEAGKKEKREKRSHRSCCSATETRNKQNATAAMAAYEKRTAPRRIGGAEKGGSGRRSWLSHQLPGAAAKFPRPTSRF